MILLLTFPLFAKEIHLKDEYCINSQILLSDFDENTTEDKTLFKIPSSTSNYKLPTIQVSYELEKYGYDVIQNENGVIKFKKFCNFNLDTLREKFSKAVQKAFKNAVINSLKIEPRNHLPSDIKTFDLKNLSVSKASIKRGEGVFLAKFITPSKRTKSIYFSFDLDASMKVFIASKKIKSRTLLKGSEYIKSLSSLKELPLDPLTRITPNTLIAKFNIKQGTILAKKSFKKKMLLRRGDKVRAILKDGALSLQIEAKALNSGDIGDEIRVLSDDGKTFNATIADSKTVYIK